MKTAAGAITRAGVSRISAFSPDTVAIALGQGHTAYGRYAQGHRRQRRSDALARRRANGAGGAAGAGRSAKARVTKTGDHVDAGHAPKDRRASTVAASRRRSTRRGARGRRRRATSITTFPGDASHEFLPGLRVAGRRRRAGRARRPERRAKHRGCTTRRSLERHGEAPLGDDDRSRALHRLLGVRHRVLRREQHSDGRRARGRDATIFADRTGFGRRTSRAAARWLDPHRALLRGRRTTAVRRGLRDALRADAVPALRQRAVRAGVPGVRDVSRARRPERAGLQPLRRHALLLEQLPVQGSLLQLVRLRRAGSHAVRVPRAAATGSSIRTSRCAARA